MTFKCDLDLQPTNLRFFFTKNPNLNKKNYFFFIFLCDWGGGGVSGGGLDAGPNQFAPSTSLKLGHNNALMYKLCP